MIKKDQSNSFANNQLRKRQESQRFWVISIGLASSVLAFAGLAFVVVWRPWLQDQKEDGDLIAVRPLPGSTQGLREEVTITGVSRVLAVYEVAAAQESMAPSEAKVIRGIITGLRDLHEHRVILDAELEISAEIDPVLTLRIDREAWNLVPAETRFEFKQVLRLRLGDTEFQFSD